MNLLQNIKDCANILRTVKQKEEHAMEREHSIQSSCIAVLARKAVISFSTSFFFLGIGLSVAFSTACVSLVSSACLRSDCSSISAPRCSAASTIFFALYSAVSRCTA